MKKNKVNGIAVIILAAAILGMALSGCSSANPSKDTAKAVTTPSASPVSSPKKIYVGTQNDYPPFCFNDENNKLTGFDVEVMKEIDNRLKEYEFEFVTAPWDSIFLSLESNRTQIAADEIAKNPEREEKYLFSDEAYFRAESVIIVKDGRNDISKLEDLVGHTVAACVGDSYSQLLEKYNAEHDKKIILKYTDSSAASGIFRDVESGRVDAYLNDPVMSKATIKSQGLKLKIVGEPVQFDNIHLTFRKDDQGKELKAKIDAVLKELKADGTLSKLSKKWTDGEYVPK